MFKISHTGTDGKDFPQTQMTHISKIHIQKNVRSISQSKHVMFYNFFTCRYGCFVRIEFFIFFSSKFGRGLYGPCGYNTYNYGHIRIRYELLRRERIDTEDLSTAAVASVYASVTTLTISSGCLHHIASFYTHESVTSAYQKVFVRI